MTFIDDHTRLCWVYLMSEKSDIENLFKNFYTMVETQFQTKIGILHSNNGTKYFNEVLGNFLSEKGIHHQSTCIYTPQQNAIAERKNKHFLEVYRAIMFSTNIPKYLWGKAMLINRMPTRVLNYTTPFKCLKNIFQATQIQSNQPPKVFGCTMFVHLTNKGQSKLDPRAEKYVFIGYAPKKEGGYKCFHPQSKRISVTMDVSFVETQPNFQKISLQREKENEERENFWDVLPTSLLKTIIF